METWSAHHLYQQALQRHGEVTGRSLFDYARRLKTKGLPVIFTLGHLAKITGVSYKMLRATVNRKREASNYRMFAIKKRSGGRRFIHSVSTDLLRVQQFINQSILQSSQPHPSSFAFHKSGGIRKCAEQHCGARWLFQYDLKDFFYDVTEIDVFRIFQAFGYRDLLAFEMARLCTTTRVPKWQGGLLFHQSEFQVYRDLEPPNVEPRLPYANRSGLVGVLPQGAPTSPMLSNLAALPLDHLLKDFSAANGMIYTRYADDLTLSATGLQGFTVAQIHCSVTNRISKAQFRVNKQKTRVAGPGSRKLVLGLLVDGLTPRIPRTVYQKIDSHLHAISTYGWEATADHWGFDSAFGFYNHLTGLIAFVKDVDMDRWLDFSARFAKLENPSWRLRR